jgi:hypothetical protein
MSKDFKLAIAILIPLGCAVAIYVPFASGTRQRANMAIAEEKRPEIQALLDADKRYKSVRALVFTGQGGSLALVGKVDAEDDLCRLMKVMAAAQLPIPVAWQVSVPSDPP